MIAEVASRFTNIEKFQSFVTNVGFRFKSKVKQPYHPVKRVVPESILGSE